MSQPLGGLTVSFEVDSSRMILASNAPELRVGDFLTPGSWLGASALEAIDAAALSGVAETRVGRELLGGTHWILHARVLQEGEFRASVVAFDATPAVSADREAVFAKLVHSLGNVGCALGSIIDVIKADRPLGAELDECVAYLSEPTSRLLATRAYLLALVSPPRLSLRRTSVDSLLERSLAREPSSRLAEVVVAPPGMMLRCDEAALSETIAAMLELIAADATPRVEARLVEVGGRLLASIAVEGRAQRPQDSMEVSGTWDLHGGQRLEPQLRLSQARALVFAHGGDVQAEAARHGSIRLAMRLPLIDD